MGRTLRNKVDFVEFWIENDWVGRVFEWIGRKTETTFYFCKAFYHGKTAWRSQHSPGVVFPDHFSVKMSPHMPWVSPPPYDGTCFLSIPGQVPLHPGYCPGGGGGGCN